MDSVLRACVQLDQRDNIQLQVYFGAEVIVEAIATDSVDESFYVTEYYVEYASNVSHYCCIPTDSGDSRENVGFNVE